MKSKLFNSKSSHGNIVFNFMKQPIGDLWAFAEGYHGAAKSLVEKLEKAKGYSDYEGYPIFFLYRHSIELYLKALLYNGAISLDLISEELILNDIKLQNSHSISKFVPLIRELCCFQGWNLKHKTKQGITIENMLYVLDELGSMDPGSYTFRYPMNRKGKANLKDHTVINVIQFGKTLDPVLEVLAGMVHYMEYQWDNAAEVMHEIQVALRSDE